MQALYIFYTFEENASPFWEYQNMPSDWKWVKCGLTAPINAPLLEYQVYEEFKGPKETREIMKKYLDDIFFTLRCLKTIYKYKIRLHYLP